MADLEVVFVLVFVFQKLSQYFGYLSVGIGVFCSESIEPALGLFDGKFFSHIIFLFM